MTSKQIAVKYIGQTIKEPESIFKNVEILKQYYLGLEILQENTLQLNQQNFF